MLSAQCSMPPASLVSVCLQQTLPQLLLQNPFSSLTFSEPCTLPVLWTLDSFCSGLLFSARWLTGSGESPAGLNNRSTPAKPPLSLSLSLRFSGFHQFISLSLFFFSSLSCSSPFFCSILHPCILFFCSLISLFASSSPPKQLLFLSLAL